MENLVAELKSIYSEKRILVTGHNGFKGSWLVALLNILGAEVHGVSLEIDQNSAFNNFHLEGPHASTIQDIRDFDALNKLVKISNPDLVFHLAAQALVLNSYENPRETFEVNVQGTANLLDSVIATKSRGVVVATTDKVYRNNNSGNEFKESDELWGHDPYSLSKTGSELVVAAWRNLQTSNHCKFVTVRAGNVYGPGDRADNRLLPDLIRGMTDGIEVVIRNPNSIRPWQYVLDPLIGYLIVGLKILNNEEVSRSYNFGPRAGSFLSVGELVNEFCSIADVRTRQSNFQGELEAKVLKLNSALAHVELGWDSFIGIKEGLGYVVNIESGEFSKTIINCHIQEYLARLSQSSTNQFHN